MKVCKICGKVFAVARYAGRTNVCSPECASEYCRQVRLRHIKKGQQQAAEKQQRSAGFEMRVRAAAAAGMSYGQLMAMGKEKRAAMVAAITDPKNNISNHNYSTFRREVKSINKRVNFDISLF